MRASGLAVSGVWAAHVPGLILAVLVVDIGWPLAELLREHQPAVVTFSVVVAVAMIVCVGVVAIWLKRARDDFAWLGGELRRLRRV